MRRIAFSLAALVLMVAPAAAQAQRSQQQEQQQSQKFTVQNASDQNICIWATGQLKGVQIQSNQDKPFSYQQPQQKSTETQYLYAYKASDCNEDGTPKSGQEKNYLAKAEMDKFSKKSTSQGHIHFDGKSLKWEDGQPEK